MELREHLRVLRRSRLLVLLTVLLVAGAATAWAFLQPPRYTATAEAFVSTRGAGSLQDLSVGGAYAQQVVTSYATVATRPLVLKSVVKDLGLPYSVPQLAERVSADVAANTVVLQIHAVDESPSRAADIANAVLGSLEGVVDALSPSGSTSAEVTMTRVTRATVDQESVSPNKPLDVLLGLLVGLAAGVGLAFLREALDIRVRTAKDVSAISEKPLLGSIAFDAAATSRPLIAGDGSPRAEAFRLLRTNLRYLDLHGEPRVFTVTSAVESEGKSTTVANLAIVMSEAEESVVVIDADLRRPRLADYFGLEGSVGLSDVLAGTADLDDAVQTWGPDGLRVITAGRVPPNPSELLQSDAMRELIAEVGARFTTVLFDAPPLLPVADATLLAKQTRGALVVAAAGRVSKTQLKGAVDALERVEARLLGYVLTMVPQKGPDSAGYRYSYGERGTDRRSSRLGRRPRSADASTNPRPA